MGALNYPQDVEAHLRSERHSKTIVVMQGNRSLTVLRNQQSSECGTDPRDFELNLLSANVKRMSANEDGK